jgi:hypothetical protein
MLATVNMSDKNILFYVAQEGKAKNEYSLMTSSEDNLVQIALWATSFLTKYYNLPDSTLLLGFLAAFGDKEKLDEVFSFLESEMNKTESKPVDEKGVNEMIKKVLKAYKAKNKEEN